MTTTTRFNRITINVADVDSIALTDADGNIIGIVKVTSRMDTVTKYDASGQPTYVECERYELNGRAVAHDLDETNKFGGTVYHSFSVSGTLSSKYL